MESKPSPKPVVISSLAVRFYLHHGWTEEVLKPYIKRGKLRLRGFGPNEGEHQYLIPYPGDTGMNLKKLVEDGHVGELLGRGDYPELRGKTDLEVLIYSAN